MYESKSEPLLTPAQFLRRLSLHAAFALALLVGSLGIGMAGYHLLENLPWLDAFLNASMLLGGMGPVNPPQSPGGKLFAGLYALYAGLVFLVTVALVFSPIVHRLMHRFHWRQDS
ncbi:MAG: hypothetical protein JWQ07_3347 [Ramlibacter sp.]|nr:hypothetical protein [Ramlibacter sp.]